MPPKCEHGVSRGDGRYAGVWHAPFAECHCCGGAFPYLNSASFGGEGSHTRTWTPHNICQECGGSYVERVTG